MLTRRRFSLGAAALGVAGALAPAARAETAEAGLAAEFARLETELGCRLGVTIVDTATEKRYGHRSSERFPMCSTFKMLASAAVLARVDAGREELSRVIRYEASDLVTYSPITKEHVGEGMTLAAICEAAVTLSDNTAGNLILRSLGGPGGLTNFARSIGDSLSRLDRWETALNEAIPGDERDTTTPEAMAANLRLLAIDGGLSEKSRTQLVAWMLGSKTGGAKLRAGLPKDWRIGDKTGAGERGTNNEVAVIWPPGRKPLIACIYITETKAGSEQSNAAMASIGKAITTALAF